MQIGVSILGGSHPHCDGRVNAILRNPNTFLNSVFDKRPEVCDRISKKSGAKIAGTPEEVLHDPNAHLILIEGTNSECSEYALMAAATSKAMLLEKPGAENERRMQQVFDAVSEHNVFCQIGYHLRYSPSVTAVKGLIEGGTIGQVTTARFHAAVMQPWLTSEWFCDPNDRGGMVHNDFCHMLDLLQMFFGPATAHHSFVSKREDVPRHIFEDSAGSVIQFEDTIAAGDCCGWETNEWITTWDIQFFGTKGSIRMGVHPPVYDVYLPEASESFPKGWSRHGNPEFDGEENYYLEIADLVAQLEAGADPRGCNVHEALSVQKVIEEMYAANGL